MSPQAPMLKVRATVPCIRRLLSGPDPLPHRSMWAPASQLTCSRVLPMEWTVPTLLPAEVLMVLTLLPRKVPREVALVTRPQMTPLSPGPPFYYPLPGMKAIRELEKELIPHGLVVYLPRGPPI